MNAFLLKIIQFFFFSIPVFFFFFIIMASFPTIRSASNVRYAKESGTAQRAQESQHIRDIDILFIGPSLSYRGMDVRIFAQNGYKSFNLGTSYQTPIQTKYLLQHFLKKMQPKIVVYSVDPLIMSDGSGIGSASEIIANQYLPLQNTAQMSMEMSQIKVYNTLLYSLLARHFKHLDKMLPSEPWSTYVAGGFVETKDRFYRSKKQAAYPFAFRADQLAAFKAIIDLLNASNQKFLLVFPPITQEKYNAFRNLNEFMTTMTQNGQFYDFNYQVPLCDTLHFYDEVHLNQAGVVLYNQAFITRFRPLLDPLVKHIK